jgi:hypothetical protein
MAAKSRREKKQISDQHGGSPANGPGASLGAEKDAAGNFSG